MAPRCAAPWCALNACVPGLVLGSRRIGMFRRLCRDAAADENVLVLLRRASILPHLLLRQPSAGGRPSDIIYLRFYDAIIPSKFQLDEEGDRQRRRLEAGRWRQGLYHAELSHCRAMRPIACGN